VMDDREDVTPGEKFYHWEMLGVPVRVEVGPKEVSSNKVTLFRRDTLERVEVDLESLEAQVEELMRKIFTSLRERSSRMMERLIVEAQTPDEVKKALSERKIARIEWCGKEDCAIKLKEYAGGEIRGSRFDVAEVPQKSCIVCGERAQEVVYVAKAY